VHRVGTERRGNLPHTCFLPAYKIIHKDKENVKSKQGFTGKNTDKPENLLFKQMNWGKSHKPN